MTTQDLKKCCVCNLAVSQLVGVLLPHRLQVLHHDQFCHFRTALLKQQSQPIERLHTTAVAATPLTQVKTLAYAIFEQGAKPLDLGAPIVRRSPRCSCRRSIGERV